MKEKLASLLDYVHDFPVIPWQSLFILVRPTQKAPPKKMTMPLRLSNDKWEEKGFHVFGFQGGRMTRKDEGDTADCARVQKACGSAPSPMGSSVRQK